MRNTLGFLLQVAGLTLLPMLILWQLEFGFRLVWMPALTAVGVLLFWLGHRLRDQSTDERGARR